MEMTQAERLLLKRIRDLEDRPVVANGAMFQAGVMAERLRRLEKRVLALEKLIAKRIGNGDGTV